MAANDANLGIWNCGQSVALVDEVVTCKELIDRLIGEAHAGMADVRGRFVARSRL